MIDKYNIEELSSWLAKRIPESITMWNRLEGRPRKNNFDRALRAEIRDPLWMLTKQWQLGEFLGDDAGSPILAKIDIATKSLEKYQLADHSAHNYDNNIPLESIVENLLIPFELDNKVFSLDLRIIMGRYWLKLINAPFDVSMQYAKKYPINAPDPKGNDSDSHICAHPETWQKFAAAQGRCMDGYEFYKFLKEGGAAAEGINDIDSDEINDRANSYMEWVVNCFLEPVKSSVSREESAFVPSRFEYQFKCSATGDGNEKVYEAEEYYTGRLDWFNLSINDKINNLDVSESSNTENTDKDNILDIPQEDIIFTFLPANIDYDGMPDTRWWKFENRKTYLGDIKPDTTDISKLLFLDFTLLYANDWFLIPLSLPAGTISNIKGMVVTNCFGERTWIKPTGKGEDDDWQRWTMYTISRKGKDQSEADNSLMLLPTVPKVQEGPALEKIALIRDEISNMVWGIETDITLPCGNRKKGMEAGRELYAFYKRLLGEPETEEENKNANIRYQIMNTVPENWIPFIPVHLKDNNRRIQLQRSSVPRIIPGGTSEPEAVKPRTFLLRVGLDNNKKQPYFIHEEEVPRSGIEVSKSFQRTRWYSGKVYTWLGIRKKVGRGEGRSGLAFDQIVNTKK